VQRISVPNCRLGNSFRNLEAIGGYGLSGRPVLPRHKRVSLLIWGYVLILDAIGGQSLSGRPVLSRHKRVSLLIWGYVLILDAIGGQSLSGRPVLSRHKHVPVQKKK